VPLDETLVVADGTYSWNVVDGNPGEQATATATITNGFVIGVTVTNGGEGYTEAPEVTIDGIGSGATATAVVENGAITAINVDATGSGYASATVTIAEPPAPYVVNYDAGTVSVTYETAPIARTEILATYEANDSSIAGALGAADSHWLELSVDGEAQTPRERVLSVPFAQVAGSAIQLNQTAIDSMDYVKTAPVIESGYLSAFGKPVIELDATLYETPWNRQSCDQIHVPEGHKIVFNNYYGSSSGYYFTRMDSNGTAYEYVRNYLRIKEAGSTPSDTSGTLFTQRLNTGNNLMWGIEFYGPIEVQLDTELLSTAQDISRPHYARVGYVVVPASFE
jgi:hypothetical protein